MADHTTDKPAYHLTEIGNAERLLDMHGQDFYYCPALGFIVWNGKRWQVDAESEVEGLAVHTIRSMYEESAQKSLDASQEKNSATRKSKAQEAETLLRWAIASERQQMIKAMIGIAKIYRKVDIARFDTHPYLFNFQNGTLDLRTGQFRSHDRNDLLTQICPYNYNPQAEAPTFQQFLHTIMLGREDIQHFLHKALGSCLTADASEQAWFLLIGEGSNGKGTLMDTICKVLGPDYASPIDAKTITQNNSNRDGSAPSPDIARLKGKRLAIASETEEGARLAPVVIKQMTGEDQATARFLGKDLFTFFYTLKLFVFTNNELSVRESTHAFWRRVRRVPFDYIQPEATKNPHLRSELLAEAEGILNWLVQGCSLWMIEGLGMPALVKAATEKYARQEDLTGRFIDDCCELDESYVSQSTEIFTAFRKWCEEEEGMRNIPDNKHFKIAMEKKGIVYRHMKRGNVCIGIKLTGADSLDIPLSVLRPSAPVIDHASNGHTNGNGNRVSSSQYDLTQLAVMQEAEKDTAETPALVLGMSTANPPAYCLQCHNQRREQWKVAPLGMWECRACGYHQRGRP